MTDDYRRSDVPTSTNNITKVVFVVYRAMRSQERERARENNSLGFAKDGKDSVEVGRVAGEVSSPYNMSVCK